MLEPAPPPEVSEAASRLRYRDLMVCAVMVDSDRTTDQSWVYIPDKDIPFGRLHEPKNWSPEMAPPGKTVLVAEYFCCAGDTWWRLADSLIGRETVHHLQRLGFLQADKVLETIVVRVPKAYPLFEVGFQEHCRVLEDYLGSFSNLHSIGRNGLFKYYNMDHAIRAGLEIARGIGCAEEEKAPAEGKCEVPSGGAEKIAPLRDRAFSAQGS
jgi:protoporphyrinogen oxidase